VCRQTFFIYLIVNTGSIAHQSGKVNGQNGHLRVSYTTVQNGQIGHLRKKRRACQVNTPIYFFYFTSASSSLP